MEKGKSTSHWYLFDRELNRRTAPHYVFQSLAAALVLMLILYVLDVTIHATIVAAIGSTTFIVFAMPHSLTAKPRNVIGGHLMGILSGALCFLLLRALPPTGAPAWQVAHITLYALAVGLSILAMVATDTEHPPAAGTALGMAASPWDWRAVAFLLASTAALSLARRMLGPRLRDLV